MSLINAVLARVFDVLLAPFRGLPPLVGLAVVSLATAVALLLIFRRTSDQRRLAAVKRQIHAALFEIRLFNDDLRAIFRAQGEILRHNLTYLRLSLVPMLWMMVPLVLVLAQLQFHYGYGGLTPGEPVLLTAHLRAGLASQGALDGSSAEVALASRSSDQPVARLDAPPQIEVQTPAVFFPATSEVVWKIAPKAAGDFELQVTVGNQSVSKRVRVADAIVRRSPVRLERGFLNQLLYPAEPALASDAPVSEIAVAYPERDVSIFGFELHWLIVYFGLTMVFAFALRKRFNVTL